MRRQAENAIPDWIQKCLGLLLRLYNPTLISLMQYGKLPCCACYFL